MAARSQIYPNKHCLEKAPFSTQIGKDGSWQQWHCWLPEGLYSGVFQSLDSLCKLCSHLDSYNITQKMISTDINRAYLLQRLDPVIFQEDFLA